MLEISEAQVAEFQGDGFLIVERIIDDTTVDVLRRCFDEVFRGEFETGVTPDEVNWQFGSGDPSLTRQICNGWKANKDIARVVTREDFGRAIAKLGGWPGTRLMIDNVLWKPPGTRPLGYHQDSAYLDWYTPKDLLSLWIALDDTSAAGGTMELVSRSHRWRQSVPEGEFHGPEDYRKHMETAARREGVVPEIVYVEVASGGGSFHHGWTWHGSGYNRGSRPRRSLVVHAMRSDTKYNPGHLGDGTGIVYSRYKHLADNEIDENYFPVLWREDGYRTPGLDTYLARANTDT
jgi:ectoine hydroxylase-related dioxygenase (phytanoyl-CoA dioxygenase family)